MATAGGVQVVHAVDVALRPLRNGNAFEECVERLLQLVRLGLVQPGDRLPAERDLAARLGVSRVTLREALHSLAGAGYVHSRRGRHGGTFVLPPPPAVPLTAPVRDLRAELDDVLVLREVLEVGAAEAAARGPVSRADAAGLRRMQCECRAAGPDRYRPLDSRLHLAVVELARSPSLSAGVADVRVRVNDLLDRIPLLPPNIEHSNAQHERLVAAVVAGRPVAAREAMAEHVAASAALLRGFLG